MVCSSLMLSHSCLETVKACAKQGERPCPVQGTVPHACRDLKCVQHMTHVKGGNEARVQHQADTPAVHAGLCVWLGACMIVVSRLVDGHLGSGGQAVAALLHVWHAGVQLIND